MRFRLLMVRDRVRRKGSRDMYHGSVGGMIGAGSCFVHLLILVKVRDWILNGIWLRLMFRGVGSPASSES